MKAEKKDEGNTVSIQTRFGVVNIILANAINFPKFILGMEGLCKYCFVDYPDEKFTNFKLLQSTEDPDITFVVLPLSDLNAYQPQDLNECATALQVNLSDCVFALIVSVQRNVEGKTEKVTVNLRAPLVIDTSNKVGYQYVFYNSAYSIRHQIL